MAPGIGIMVLLAFTVAWGLFCAGCLSVLIVGWVRKSRPLQLLGGIPLIVSLIAILFLVFQDKIIPIDHQARSLMAMPAEAQVVKVEYGEWAGDGRVYFRLPPTRSEKEWLDIVWRMNLPDKEELTSGNIDRKPHQITFTYGGARREVSYDPVTKLYLYDVFLKS